MLEGGHLAGGVGRDVLEIASTNAGVVFDGNRGIVAGRTDTLTGSPSTGGAVRRVSGFEVVVGTEGNDILAATDGEDMTLRGMGGDDDLIGGSGNDVLDGGKGSDILAGGAGADIFVLSAGSGSDIVEDFDILRDRILLAGYGQGAVARFGRLDRDSEGHWVVHMLVSGDVESVNANGAELSVGDWVVAVRSQSGSMDRLVLGQTSYLTDPLPLVGVISVDTGIDLASGDLLQTDFVLGQPVQDIVADAVFRKAYFGAFDLAAHNDIDFSFTDAARGVIAWQDQGGQSHLIHADPAQGAYRGISGSSGDDVLFGSDHSSVLFGGVAGDDILVGGRSNDILIATLRPGTVEMEGNGGADLFVLVKNHEIDTVDGHLEAIAKVNDFNRAEGDKIVMAGFDIEKEPPIIDKVVDNHQQVHFADGLTVVFDLSFIREVDANFSLRMSDFERV